MFKVFRMQFLFIALFSIILLSCGGDSSTSSDKCADSKCGDWQICNPLNGNCELKSNRCEKQDDCLSGYTCDTDTHECKMAIECFTNSDCNSFLDKPVCENGICVAEKIDKCENVDCDDWKYCDAATGNCFLKLDKCDEDANCLNGYTCDTSVHECKMTTECFTNSDCSDDTPVCRNGLCIPLMPTDEYCSSDFDCSANTYMKTCINNRCAVDDCTEFGYECSRNTNNRYMCENNKCVEPEDMNERVKTRVLDIMNSVTSTHYQNREYSADMDTGVWNLDCSYFVKQIVRKISREHYDEFPKTNSSLRTALAADYYRLFKAIKAGKYHSDLWESVDDMANVKAGDIIAYKYSGGTQSDGGTTGHVMVIMSTPVHSACSDSEQYWVWVADSANSGHYDDTRDGVHKYEERVLDYDENDYFDYTAELGHETSSHDPLPSGIGIGKMYFNLNPSNGDPYFRWNACAGYKNELPEGIFVGRMIKKAQ